METRQVCSECGAIWHEEQTCQDHFHQMLFWENENPRDGSEMVSLLTVHGRMEGKVSEDQEDSNSWKTNNWQQLVHFV
jgi:hypothetical protein